MDRTHPPPHNLPLLPPDIDVHDRDIAKALVDARVALESLNNLSFLDPILVLSPFVLLKESLASSEIENIHTTMHDVLESRLLPPDERREADEEVLRYEAAIRAGFVQWQESGLSTRLVHRIHHTLLPHYNGEYRRVQNCIRDFGTGEIVYVPPAASDIPVLMSNWEQYLNQGDDTDPLIKAIVGHYQFEAIHPFGDGNGRTGRMLLVFTLMHHGLLTSPVLYLSGYINVNRPEYYAGLKGVTDTGDWKSFILFMLRGVAKQAEKSHIMLRALQDLRDELFHEIGTEHPNIYSLELVDALSTTPITTPTQLAASMGVHRVTASKYLKQLAQDGLLETKKHGRHQLYINKRFMDLFHKPQDPRSQ